jgi:dTMP kinase
MGRVKRGVFICIEGVDASGKTTQAHLLVENLKRRGFDVDYTKEPSEGRVGEFIMHYVLNRKERLPVAVEALLFAADRVDHIENLISPALERGKIIVCDRYIYSTLAYQGAVGLSLDWIEQINKFALVPDIALFLDAHPEIVFERLKRKKSVMETLQNQLKVREMYINIVNSGRLTLVNGDNSIGQVSEIVLKIVLDFLTRSQIVNS